MTVTQQNFQPDFNKIYLSVLKKKIETGFF